MKTALRPRQTTAARPAVRAAFSVFAALALFANVSDASAQTFSISPSVIASGGGTSTGGVFSVSGTIGQLAAGNLAGGNLTLQGGFWSSAVAVQTPGAPHLNVVRSGGNYVITWADTGAGFVLEVATALQTLNTSWNNSGATPTLANGTNTVTLPAQPGKAFYRLRKP
ncbi:hypothetical protein LBMAG56_34430 [Verrucomicrobiota bacterium]|nr:hypothetical protein LBMAG56_34430 [Verrucomicrobiota bacterium]